MWLLLFAIAKSKEICISCDRWDNRVLEKTQRSSTCLHLHRRTRPVLCCNSTTGTVHSQHYSSGVRSVAMAKTTKEMWDKLDSWPTFNLCYYHHRFSSSLKVSKASDARDARLHDTRTRQNVFGCLEGRVCTHRVRPPSVPTYLPDKDRVCISLVHRKWIRLRYRNSSSGTGILFEYTDEHIGFRQHTYILDASRMEIRLLTW